MSRIWGRTVRRVGVALGLVVGLLVTVVTPAQAAQHQGGAIAVYWNFHGANGFWNIDQFVRVLQKSHHSYWAMQWGFTATPNEGGYMGLQTDGIRFDGTRGETAIFSLWNANASRGTCGRSAARARG